MKFYISSAFLNTREIIEIAKAADELGYDGIGIPDHVVNLESLDTPYPYTKDGQRRWQPFTDWPDPWVLVGALAQVTTRQHRLHSRDAQSLLGGQSHWHRGSFGVRTGGARRRRGLVQRGIRVDGRAVRRPRQAHR
jgi:hypothetical protein